VAVGEVEVVRLGVLGYLNHVGQEEALPVIEGAMRVHHLPGEVSQRGVRLVRKRGVAAFQEGLTVSRTVDITVMELLPENGEALIYVLMSMASRQEGELNLTEVTKVDKLAEEAKGVHILVLRSTVVHLEVEHRGPVGRLLQDLVYVVPEV